MKRLILLGVAIATGVAACAADSYEEMKRAAVNRERLVIWDDDGCDMTHYPYQRADLVKQPASVRNFELVFLEATENTKADVIGYSGTMGFGYFTALRTGSYVITNRFAAADQPWRNAVNEFAAMGLDALDITTSFARRNGKEVFLSLRFNDNHDSEGTPEKPSRFLSPFKAQNPEVMVGHGRQVKCCGWTATCRISASRGCASRSSSSTCSPRPCWPCCRCRTGFPLTETRAIRATRPTSASTCPPSRATTGASGCTARWRASSETRSSASR